MSHVVPVSQYFTDLTNGTLPQVALIEGGYESGLDEHPLNDVQNGSRYVSTLINALMGSSSWSSSVFFLTYDEAGAGYDHVAPMMNGVNGANVPNPDGIKPLALQPGDICFGTPDAPACDFTRTGFRMPLLVVSPFTKPNYVSHTPMDSTAILKFIETRFGLQNLNNRDAAQPPMDEFFDYSGAPNATPPTPPAQPGADCDGLTNTCTGPTMPVLGCNAANIP
jgi:phospholipase C